LFGFAFFHAIV
jgi:dynein heavy chain